MKLFSGQANKPLALEIAKHLKMKLSQTEIHIFPDGEKRVRIFDETVGEDCFVVQSASTPADTNYMELFFITDALKRGGAGQITAIIPYLGYERQDHLFRVGECVSLEVIAKILKTVGVDRVIAFDLHSIKIPEIFGIPVVHLSALSLFAKKIREKKLDDGGTVLVSADMGGIRRIKLLSEMLNNMPYASIEKNRDLSTGEVSTTGIEGEVLQKAIIVDDMISTGSTIVASANLLKEKGVRQLYVFATHPVFSADAPKILQESGVKEIFVTDTIFVPEEKRFPKLQIFSVSDMIAKEIKNKI